ncbi:MAG TPA: hypothetical protein VIN33_08190 [Marinobacter sp.]
MNTMKPAPGRGKQWLWFFGLWIGGVVTVGTISMILRWILLP